MVNRVARVHTRDWEAAKRLFAEALPLDATARERLLTGTCAGRERLRTEVESLLDAHVRAGGLLETGAAERGNTRDALIGQRLGPYLLESVLGQGGMSVVYRARREAPARDVAIKIVRLDPQQTGLARRFELESRALARLDHPHIARLFDAGRTPDGRPYFVLELVEGRALDQHCAQERPNLRARLDLFLKLCAAVAYAHGRLVVHRDLKPGNVLVTSDGALKLLDFGVAQLLDAGLGPRATKSGLLLMTPAYASPEQVRGGAATVATDVHGLGLLLHLLLTGCCAFQLRSGAADELVRVVCLDDPPAPSVDLTRPRTPADCFEPAEPGPRLARLLRGDLDSIVARALRKEPQARYVSVDELQADVRRYLDGEPVQARGGRWRYRAGKFVRRQRLMLTLGTGLFLALAGGVATTLWQARVARAERMRADQRFADVRRMATSLLFDFHDAIRDLPGSTKARELVVAKATGYLEGLAREAGQDPALQLELARAYQRVGTVQGISGQANLGDATGAARSLTRAWELLGQAEPTFRRRPEFVLARVEIATDLGRTRRALGQFDRLVPLWQEAERTATSIPANAAGAPLFAARVRLLADLALEYERRGELDEAERAARRQLQTALDLQARFPKDPYAGRALAAAHRSLASIQIHLGRYADARTNALAAVSLQRAGLQPGDTGSARRLAHALIALGKVERDGDLDLAVAAYAEAAQIVEGLVAQDAANTEAAHFVVGVLGSWCWCLDRAGRHIQGRDICSDSLHRAERAANPRDAFASMNLVSSRYFAAWQRELQGDRDGALQLYERALAATTAPVLDDSGPELRAARAEIWSATARLRLESGHAQAAAAAATRALDQMGALTNAARHDPDELETRLLALVVLMRVDLGIEAGRSQAFACAHLEQATAIATDLRGLTSGLPRKRPLLAQFDKLRERCLQPHPQLPSQ